jgi:hypothetical protein
MIFIYAERNFGHKRMSRLAWYDLFARRKGNR